MPGLQYRFPKIYDLGIRLIHRPKVLNEFKKLVGTNVSVFDVAAGFGRMSRYIDSSNSYQGIDLNPVSLRYAKEQGINIVKGDIFDPKAYIKSDVIILVDVVHHMDPSKLTELFDLVFAHARKKVVIMEPSFVNLQEKYGLVGKLMDWVLMKLDSDGINDISSWFTKEEYLDLMNHKFNSKLGSKFTVSIDHISPYNLVTYTKK